MCYKNLCGECLSSESWLLNISGWHVSFYPFKKCNHRVSGWKPFFGTSFCPRRRVWVNNTKSHCHTLHQKYCKDVLLFKSLLIPSTNDRNGNIFRKFTFNALIASSSVTSSPANITFTLKDNDDAWSDRNPW